MNNLSRREWFLAAACWTDVLHAQKIAPQFQYFDPATASEIEAIAETILPGDQTPGAREAGVIWFIDGALAGYDKDLQAAYKQGLAETQTRRAALFPHSTTVAALTPGDRIQLLADIEKTDFFSTVRRHTILGFFGHPRHGGNRNGASAKLLGIQQTMMYSPPFGYYDREASQ
jgi:gluconate 2-dehydrogenase gamma chain